MPLDVPGQRTYQLQAPAWGTQLRFSLSCPHQLHVDSCIQVEGGACY